MIRDPAWDPRSCGPREMGEINAEQNRHMPVVYTGLNRDKREEGKTRLGEERRGEKTWGKHPS